MHARRTQNPHPNTYYGHLNKKGEKHGYGVMVFHQTGAVYRGEWDNDKMHGKGHYSWGDGNNYDGFFVNGKQKGLGIYSWPTGGRYYGNWDDDKMCGNGIYIRQDDVVYEGLWKDDHQYGYGIKKIPQRIAHGKEKITTNARIIKELWGKRKVKMQLEKYKIPKFSYRGFRDIKIVTKEEEKKRLFQHEISEIKNAQLKFKGQRQVRKNRERKKRITINNHYCFYKQPRH